MEIQSSAHRRPARGRAVDRDRPLSNEMTIGTTVASRDVLGRLILPPPSGGPMLDRCVVVGLLITTLGCGGGGGGGGAEAPHAPAAVSGLTFSVTPVFSLGGAKIDFAWGGGTGATSARLHVGSGAGNSDVGILDTGGATNAFKWDAPVGSYYVRVQAVNAVGEGPASNEVHAVSVDP